jgi:hypothetical protein
MRVSLSVALSGFVDAQSMTRIRRCRKPRQTNPEASKRGSIVGAPWYGRSKSAKSTVRPAEEFVLATTKRAFASEGMVRIVGYLDGYGGWFPLCV